MTPTTNFEEGTQKSINFIYQWTYEHLRDFGIAADWADVINMCCLVFLVYVLLYVIRFLMRKLLLPFLKKTVAKTETKFDDYLLSNNTFSHFIRMVQIFVAQQFIPVVFTHYPATISTIQKTFYVIWVISWLLFIRSIFRSFKDHLSTRPAFIGKPLNSYLQVVNIILYFICGILIISILMEKSPLALLGALGAASAVLMLVFKDSILGFVASIQVSTNDMVRIGDWVEMSKYGANGTVKEINLNTVKIQNFDMSISTIPTYYLITDSLKNWRGMQKVGGRRVNRFLNIKIDSIHYLTKEELEKLRNMPLLKDFFSVYDKKNISLDTQSERDILKTPLSEARLTNLGIFRAYIKNWIQSNPKVRKDMAIHVRQLQSSEHGLPLDVYFFINDTNWGFYEEFLADFFEHIIAAVKYFNLSIAELPTAEDGLVLKEFNPNDKTDKL